MSRSERARTRWITSRQDAPWQTQPAPVWSGVDRLPSVMLQLDEPQQVIEGFGACFSEMGWTSLSRVDEARRDEIMKELFAPGGDGAHLTLCRMPIGANDIARDWYSLDDTPGDLTLEHFSVARDEQSLIPFIQAAQRHQPELSLWASPWSPPTWMKTNGHYAGALPHPAFPGVQNGIREDQVGREGTDMIRLDEDILASYAAYFGRFIDAYADRGIPVRMVMPQNEFNSAQVFPSCTWTPEGLAAFIRHLGPEMDRRGVEVFLGTWERPDPTMIDRVLADPVAGPYIAGVGVQWHARSAVPIVRRDHPGLRLYQSEQECGDGTNSWRMARRAWDLMRDFLTNGANAYMYWNIALLDGGLSGWNWAQNSLFSVDPATGEARANVELTVLKHVSHFVQEGARAIPTVSYTGYENQVAFRNPDGEVIVVVQNPLAEPMELSIAMGERMIAVTLPADSLNTLVLPPEG